MPIDGEPREAIMGDPPGTSGRLQKLFRSVGWATFVLLPVLAFSFFAYGTSSGLAFLLLLIAFVVSFAAFTALTLAGVTLGLMLWKTKRYPKSIVLHALTFLASVWLWWFSCRTDVDISPKWGEYSYGKTHFNWLGRIRIPDGITSDEPLIPFSQIQRIIGNGWRIRAGFCDRNGCVVVPAKFQQTFPFKEGRSIVQALDGKYGVIDNEGQFVVDPIYDSLEMAYFEGLLSVRVNNKWGFLDLNGTIAIAPEYDAVRFFQQGLAAANVGGKRIVKKNQFSIHGSFDGGLWGYIDKAGKVVIPLQFVEADSFSETRARIKRQDGTQWFIDRSGQAIQPLSDEEKYYYR